MFDSIGVVLTEIVKPQAVALTIDYFNKVMPECYKVRRRNITLKHAILYSLSIFHTDFGDIAQAPPSRRCLSVHIIGNNYQHRSLPHTISTPLQHHSFKCYRKAASSRSEILIDPGHYRLKLTITRLAYRRTFLEFSTARFSELAITRLTYGCRTPGPTFLHPLHSFSCKNYFTVKPSTPSHIASASFNIKTLFPQQRRISVKIPAQRTN